MYSYPHPTGPEFQNVVSEMAAWANNALSGKLLDAERELWSGALLTELADGDFMALLSFHLALAARIAANPPSGPSPDIYQDFLFVHRAKGLLDRVEESGKSEPPSKIETNPNPNFKSTNGNAEMKSPVDDPLISMVIDAGYTPYDVLSPTSKSAAFIAGRYGFSFEPTGTTGEVCFAGSDELRPGFRTTFTCRDVADLALVRLIAPGFREMWRRDASAANRMLPVDESAFDQCIELGRRLRLRPSTGQSTRVEGRKESFTTIQFR